MANKQQVFSEQALAFGKYMRFFWSWPGDNSVVPASTRLDITALTFSYFPANGGSVGRADVAGRDVNGNAVWRVQIVYVEQHKTVHLTFPGGLSVEAGGFVEMGFVNDGPGEIFASANGKLVEV